GDGHLVAAALADARGVAARGEAIPAHLRPRVLGRGLPTRDVRSLHAPPRPGVRAPIPGPARGGVRLGLPGGLGGHRARPGAPARALAMRPPGPPGETGNRPLTGGASYQPISPATFTARARFFWA